MSRQAQEESNTATNNVGGLALGLGGAAIKLAEIANKRHDKEFTHPPIPQPILPAVAPAPIDLTIVKNKVEPINTYVAPVQPAPVVVHQAPLHSRNTSYISAPTHNPGAYNAPSNSMTNTINYTSFSGNTSWRSY